MDLQLLAELQGESISWGVLEHNARTALGTLVVLGGLGTVLLVGGICLSKTLLFRSMVLSTVQDTHQGYTARVYSDSLIGLQGTAQTPLRPAGKALIGGICYDVKTAGIYVTPGAKIVVTDAEGTSLTVQAIE